MNNSLVSAGQNITFQLTCIDPDKFRLPGGAWQNFGAPKDWGTYKIKLTLTDAKFTGTTKTEETFTAQRPQNGIFALRNIPVTVDSTWDGTNDVKVDIKITDEVAIPAQFLAEGQVNTNLQDAVTTLTLSWKKATSFPTTLTPDHQPPGALESTQPVNPGITIWYLVCSKSHP